MNTQQVFESKGFSLREADDVDKTLASLEFDALLDITDELLSEPVEFTGDESTQCMVLRYALLNAFKSNSESLTKEDFSVAYDQIESLNATVNAPEEVEPEPEVEVTDNTPSKPVRKVSESKKIFAELKEFISDNPDVNRKGFIDQMKAKDYDLSASTLGQYFYVIRKELGLSGNGKRGRPKNDTMERITELYVRMDGSTPAEIKAAISEKFDLTEKTAVVYFHKAKKAVEANK